MTSTVPSAKALEAARRLVERIATDIADPTSMKNERTLMSEWEAEFAAALDAFAADRERAARRLALDDAAQTIAQLRHDLRQADEGYRALADLLKLPARTLDDGSLCWCRLFMDVRGLSWHVEFCEKARSLLEARRD